MTISWRSRDSHEVAGEVLLPPVFPSLPAPPKPRPRWAWSVNLKRDIDGMGILYHNGRVPAVWIPLAQAARRAATAPDPDVLRRHPDQGKGPNPLRQRIQE